MTSTPSPQQGIWTLTAPDGRTWQADSPLKAVSAEQRERVPAKVAVDRIFAACEEAQTAVLAVPGWRLVPVEPTPEMIAAATVAVLPDASPEDFELARQAARIVLAHPNAPEGVSLEAIAAAMATIIPAHKAMLAAAPAIHEGGEHA